MNEDEIKALRQNKKDVAAIALRAFNNDNTIERLTDKIASLTLALQAAHKGIARLNKKITSLKGESV